MDDGVFYYWIVFGPVDGKQGINRSINHRHSLLATLLAHIL
jgi:hypothetical protein